MTQRSSSLSAYLFRAVGILSLGGLAFILAAALLTASKSRTHAFLLRLQPGAEPIPPAALEHTADVLSRRLAALGGRLDLIAPRAEARPPDTVSIRFTQRWTPDTQQAERALASALAWLTMPARIEFRLVHPDQGLASDDGDQKPPDGYERKVYRARQYMLHRPGDVKTVEQPCLLRTEPLLALDGFRKVSIETTGLKKMAALTFELHQQDAQAFAAATALHVGRQMAMLIDGEMFLPPREIESAITGGSVQVQGYFFLPPLRNLVAVLNTGPLPCPLQQVRHTVE